MDRWKASPSHRAMVAGGLANQYTIRSQMASAAMCGVSVTGFFEEVKIHDAGGLTVEVLHEALRAVYAEQGMLHTSNKTMSDVYKLRKDVEADAVSLMNIARAQKVYPNVDSCRLLMEIFRKRSTPDQARITFFAVKRALRNATSAQQLVLCEELLFILARNSLFAEMCTIVKEYCAHQPLTSRMITAFMRESAARGDSRATEVYWNFAKQHIKPWPPKQYVTAYLIWLYVISQRKLQASLALLKEHYTHVCNCPDRILHALISQTKGDASQMAKLESFVREKSVAYQDTRLTALMWRCTPLLIVKEHDALIARTDLDFKHVGSSVRLPAKLRRSLMKALCMSVLLPYGSLERMLTELCSDRAKLEAFMENVASIRTRCADLQEQMHYSWATEFLAILLRSVDTQDVSVLHTEGRTFRRDEEALLYKAKVAAIHIRLEVMRHAAEGTFSVQQKEVLEAKLVIMKSRLHSDEEATKQWTMLVAYHSSDGAVLRWIDPKWYSRSEEAAASVVVATHRSHKDKLNQMQKDMVKDTRIGHHVKEFVYSKHKGTLLQARSHGKLVIEPAPPLPPKHTSTATTTATATTETALTHSLKLKRAAKSPVVKQQALASFYTRQFHSLRSCDHAKETSAFLLGELQRDRAEGFVVDVGVVTALVQVQRMFCDTGGIWNIVQEVCSEGSTVQIDKRLTSTLLSSCADMLRDEWDGATDALQCAMQVWAHAGPIKGFRLYTRMMEVLGLSGAVEQAEALLLEAPPVPSLGYVLCPYMVQHFEQAYVVRGVPPLIAVERMKHLIATRTPSPPLPE